MKRIYSSLSCLLLVMVGLGLITAPAHAQGYHFAFKFGGLVDGQLYNPSGVAVDSSGNVIVVDTENYRIQVLDSQGNFLRTIGNRGYDDGEFFSPLGVAVSVAGGNLAAAAGILLGFAGIAVALLLPIGLTVRASRWHVPCRTTKINRVIDRWPSDRGTSFAMKLIAARQRPISEHLPRTS